MKTFDHISGNEIKIDDAVIYYEQIENKDKPALVFLHGGLGHIEELNTLLAGLCSEFHIIGIDTRGHGRSTLGTAKLTYAKIQEDVEYVLESLNIKKASFVGFSDGGIVAYRIAAKGNIEVDRLITISATWTTDDIIATHDVLSSVTAESWKTKFPKWYDQYQLINPEKNFEKLVTSIKSMWLDRNYSGHPNEKVNSINAPTLIIRGDEDHLLSRKSATELADHIRNSKLLNIPYASHMPFAEQPVILQIMVHQFLGC